jgi:hypothetical protein
MAAQTTGAIALRPTGNAQGGFYFMSLTTGRRISRSRCTELPIPRDVIEWIHTLARQQQAPIGLEVLNWHREEIDLDDAADAQHLANVDHIAGVNDNIEVDNDNMNHNGYKNGYKNKNDDEDENVDDDNNGFNNNINHPAIIHPEWYDNDHEHRDPYALQDRNLVAWWRRGGDPAELDGLPLQEAPAQEILDGEPNVLAGDNGEPDNQEQNHNQHNGDQVVVDNQIEANMEARYGPRTQAYELRPQRPRNYDHLHVTTAGVALTQMSMKKGLIAFGESGKKAVADELKQLHDCGVMVPVDDKSMSEQQRRKALEYLMFLKKKRCGKIKGRGCADGCKQRVYTAKEEASSPTVSVESLMLSCTIDATEGRDVATADIPGAFRGVISRIFFERTLFFGPSIHPKPGRLAHVLADAAKIDASFVGRVYRSCACFFASTCRVSCDICLWMVVANAFLLVSRISLGRFLRAR